MIDTPKTILEAHGKEWWIRISWTPVEGAARYEVSLAPGRNAKAGFRLVERDAASPYTIHGLADGDYTWAVRAIPKRWWWR